MDMCPRVAKGRHGGGGMRNKKAKTICPESTEFAVFTIHHELNQRDVLSKLRKVFRNPYDNVWMDLNEIAKTDFTAESLYNLKNFIKGHQKFYPKGKVIVVADTELSYTIAKTTFSLLRLDGFKGHAQLFSSKRNALKWAKLADLLSSDCAAR
jgi:hypothetical protein